jgi:hypothetical protein
MNKYIVSGASSNHYKSLLQFINSVYYNEPDCHLIIYDLGLTNEENIKVKESLSRFSKNELHIFDYSKYPSYYNIHINAGEYAWKSAIIYEVSETHPPGLILWCDSGNILQSPQNMLWFKLENRLIGSTTTDGNIKKWTHPLCLQYFNIKENDEILFKENKNGAIIAFNNTNQIIKDFIKEWYTCCSTKECIAPEGSSRQNHRQDQAVFTILYYKYCEKYVIGYIDNSIDIAIHKDID